MIQQKLKNGMVSLIASEGHYLRKIGTSDAETNEITRCAIKADKALEYEEVLTERVMEAKAEAEAEQKYKARVVELIREKYSADDEAAILRKYLAVHSQPQPFSDAKMDEIVMEFDAYNAFAEECKSKAKAESKEV